MEAVGGVALPGKLSALNIRWALDASLRRPQTDYIDLYQFHHIDRNTPWEEIWQAIDRGAGGQDPVAGSSNFAGWHITDAEAAAARRNLMGLISEQSLYNLLVRDIELEVVPAAEHYGLGIIRWSPLQDGLLGGVIKKQNTGVRRLKGRAAQSRAENRDQVQAYEGSTAQPSGAQEAVSPRRLSQSAAGHFGGSWSTTRESVASL